MESNSQSAYWETEVLTATPQKMRLMLINRALQLALQAAEQWEADPSQPYVHAVSRCRGILAELASTVNGEASELASQVRQLYAFLLKSLIEADRTRDVNKLSDIVDVLRVERGTWREVCHRMPEAPAGHRMGKAPEVTARTRPATGLLAPDGGCPAAPSDGGKVSFQA